MSRSHVVARNILATLATQLLSWALTFAVTLFLPRYVGDAGLGKLAFAGSFVALFGVVVPLGTSTVLVTEIARDRGRTGELLVAALLLRLPLALLLGGMAVVAVRALHYSPLICVLVGVGALGLLVGTVNDALGAALQGQENLPRQSVGVLVDKFLASGLTIFLVLRHAPLWELAAVGLWTGLASTLVNAAAFRALWPSLRLPDLRTVRSLALAGLPFLGWTAFRTMYGQTDPVVLKFVTNDETVGWYAAAFRLVGTTMFLPVALATALLPTLARFWRDDRQAYDALVRRLLLLVMVAGVPFAAILIAQPEWLISLLHYPSAFRHSVPVLRVGGVGVLLWFAGSVLGTAIFAADGQRGMFRSSVFATVLGLPGCALGALVADRLWHNGAVGAIASDVLLEVYLIWAYTRILPARTLGVDSLSGLGRCLAAALPMVAVLALLSRFGWGVWGLGPALAAYSLCCLALGCLRPQDLTLARQAFARKTNG